MPAKRKVHIGDQVWHYRVGSSYINIWSPDGRRSTTTETAITGISPYELERAYWKGYAQGVRPSMIKTWIEENLIAKEESL